ncbi:hypothetical protein FSARC_3560 [Fusarium sarcochroum]|uniref:Uncharacterized protein n=1 Tax=Fusarium sarcochroum TaxID=1208366 RepID=A0A8H4XCI9_9HYPO|nr:hypothetical protein FSARC_3560 [Fusarium sarcochroum]
MGATISTTNDAAVVANSIFSKGVKPLAGAAFNGGAYKDATGTFNYGPFGIGSGGILTTGDAGSADSNGPFNINVENGRGPSSYCGGSGSFDAAVLTVDIEVESGYNGVQVEFVFASEEYKYRRPDSIAILLDGQQFALDPNGDQMTATGYYLSSDLAIVSTNDYESWSTYAGSSPPLVMGIPATPGQHSMAIAICDSTDGHHDSALFIKAKGCVDCDPDIKINYVTSTTTTNSDFTRTKTAYRFESGTVLIGVASDATTTTTSEAFTTTSTELSTTIASTEVFETVTSKTSTDSTAQDSTATEISTTASTENSTSDISTATSSEKNIGSTTDTTSSTTITSADSSVTAAASSGESTTLSIPSTITMSLDTTTTRSDASTMTTLITTHRGLCRAK